MKNIRVEKFCEANKGITLITLVITIIVLIILAGVAINLSLGNNGLFNKSKQAKENYKQAEANEQAAINETAEYINRVSETEKAVDIETVIGGDYFSKPTTVKDINENLIKVPQGFKIAADSGKNVTEGIVIEDNDIIAGIGNNRGNQYVWIPVGKGIKKNNGETVDITLGRYTFADGTNDKGEDGTILTKGTPILQQSAENHTQENLINGHYKELAISRTGVASKGTDGLNTTALNLKGFVDSVKTNGGYYIARYEASYGTDGKANSKVSNTFIDANGTAPTDEGTLWNNITQIDAAMASRNLYATVNTDLINSYAWDTAIVYIQNFSGDTDYSYQDGYSIKNSLTNTGDNRDEKNKINDMASNAMEFTTEHSSYKDSTNAYSCVYRGGNYYNSSNCTSRRYSGIAIDNYKERTFRLTLYI